MKKIIIGLSFITFLYGASVQELIKKNKCMTCHNIIGMKEAPPFAGIAHHNNHWYGKSKRNIINSIKNGSKGKYPMFLNTKMPAYNNLTNEELNLLADWIFSQEMNKMHHKNWNCMMHKDGCDN